MSVMRTTAVLSRLRSIAASNACIWCGRNRWLMSRSASIFSLRSVTMVAMPVAAADLYCSVKLLSLGPTVGRQSVTALRYTCGEWLMQSILVPWWAQ